MTNRISVYQSNLLYDILTKNETVWNVIAKLEKVNLPDCFVGAGCIAQTVWNHFHGFDSASYINDIDLVYFDDSDLSIEKESEMIKSVNLAFPNIPIRLDIKIRQEFIYGIKIISDMRLAHINPFRTQLNPGPPLQQALL